MTLYESIYIPSNEAIPAPILRVVIIPVPQVLVIPKSPVKLRTGPKLMTQEEINQLKCFELFTSDMDVDNNDIDERNTFYSAFNIENIPEEQIHHDKQDFSILSDDELTIIEMPITQTTVIDSDNNSVIEVVDDVDTSLDVIWL